MSYTLLAPHRAQAVIACSYSTTPLLTYYSLEEISNGLCVGATPKGPPTPHRDEMTPPPPLLDCTVLYFTLLYIYRCAMCCDKYFY